MDPLDDQPPAWEIQVVVKYQNGIKYLAQVAEYAPAEYSGPPQAHRPSWVPESTVHEVWKEPWQED